ncbi:hypothetical protein WJX74_000739 [Apatococcus lobatus]|uniref:Pre-rRNA-processing protein RIX1 N-terminal domain-containing protein n=1 Tax=Apatococcus lobatus TaxID=904363 RepID=A0AAW1QCI2_9CHLO
MEVSPAGWTSVLSHLGQAAAGGSGEALQRLQHTVRQQGVGTDRLSNLSSSLECATRALFSEKEDGQLAGLQMLVIIIPETPAASFRASYMAWGAQALGLLKACPQSPHASMAWAVLQQIFIRVEQVVEEAGVRKEASGLMQRLMQIAVPLLPQAAKQSGEGSVGMVEAIMAGARALPPAMRSSCAALEAFCRSLLPAPSAPPSLRSACAALYPLLPRAHGDATSWETAMQQLLVTIQNGLDALFMGLDAPPGSHQSREGLRPGVAGFWPAGKAGLGQAATQGQAQGVMACVDTLEHMLCQSQPLPVPLPATAIFLALTRILAFDDSPAHQGRVPPSASGYRELLMVLPGLHSAVLQLLQQLLKACGGSLRPLYASLMRLVSDLLRRIAAAGPSAFSLTSWLVRVEVYKLAGAVVQAAGWAAGRQITPTLIQAARLELYGHPSGSIPNAADEDPLAKIAPHKKRKRGKSKGQGGASGNPGAPDGLGPGLHGAEGASAAALEPWQRETSVQLAVLELLELLLQVCGAVIPQDQRLQLDAMAAHMASSAFAAADGLSAAVETGGREGLAATLQLAACRALVASVLAPAPHAPPFLPLTLRLLRQGLHSSDALLSTLCTSALLSLEPLVHPRATPPAPTHPLPLQPGRAVAPHSYTGPSRDGEALGMPRMWSPIHPDWTAHETMTAIPAAPAPIPPTGQPQHTFAADNIDTGGLHNSAREAPPASGIPMTQQQPVIEAHTAGNLPMPNVSSSQQDPGLVQSHSAPIASSAEVGVSFGVSADLGESVEPALRIHTRPGQSESLPKAPGPTVPAQPEGPGAVQHQALPSQQLQQPKVLLPGFEGAKNISIFGVDSSDSEGPMPEIDSGSDDAMDHSSDGGAD